MKINSNNAIFVNSSLMQNKHCISNMPPSFSSNSNGANLSDALNVLSSFNKHLVKKKITLEPKPFFDESFGMDTKSVLSSAKRIPFKFIQKNGDYARIKKEYKPKTLKIYDKQISTEHISNLYFPFGSLAISSDLRGKLSTDGLWQCAAASIVDKKHDLQTLLHFCPSVPTIVNEKLLEHILSVSNPKDLDITIVPGCYDDTDLTVDYLYNKFLNKGAKVTFANFPDTEHLSVVLKDGKLFAANHMNVIKDINPVDKLSVATSFFM